MQNKKSIDLEYYPCSDEKTEVIVGDYLTCNLFSGGVDIITCFQVLEHIDDEHVSAFAQKLLRESRITVVSVPYMWPKGHCDVHLQDPVDVKKFLSWFGKNPVFLTVVNEKRTPYKRLIAVFVRGQNPQTDIRLWQQNAKDNAAEIEEWEIKRGKKPRKSFWRRWIRMLKKKIRRHWKKCAGTSIFAARE